MKKLYSFIAVFIGFISQAQIVSIPDANFKAKLLTSSTTTYVALNSTGNMMKIDANSDNQIQVTEAAAVYKLYVANSAISDLTGIASFTNLQLLQCNNNTLTALNLTNANLQQLDCQSNSFVSLTINALPALTTLNLFPNSLLQNLTVTNNPLLTTFSLGSSAGSLTALVNLDCSHNALSNFTVYNGSYPMTNLANVNLSYNNLSGMLGGNPYIKVLNVSNNHLTSVSYQSNNIIDLNVANNQLTTLAVYQSANLTTIDYSGNPLITNLSLTNTKLINLSVSNLNYLQYLNCNLVTSYPGTKLNTLTISNLPALISLNCSNNNLTSLNISNFPNLATILPDDNPNNNIILSNLPSITTLDLDWSANSININNMPNLASLTFNYSGFNNITVDAIPSLTQLHYVQPSIYNQFNLTNLPNLATMTFYGHKSSAFNLTIASLPALTSLDLDISNYCNLSLTNLPALYTLEFSTITTINVHDLPALHTLKSIQGSLSSMTLTNLPSLYELLVNNNSLTGLVLQNFPALHTVDVESNNITNLVLSNLPNLYDLNLGYNYSSATGLTYNFSNLPMLYTLDLTQTNVPTTITLNTLPNLHDFLFNTNNTKITSLSFNNLPNLYTCRVGGCTNLTSLTLTSLNNLYEFTEYSTKLASISVTNLPNLHDLTVKSNNTLGSNITLNTLPNLYKLDLSQNNTGTLALSNFPNLYDVNVSMNSFLQNFTLTNLPALNKLDVSSCTYNLASLDLSSCPAIQQLIYQATFYDALKYINLKNGNASFTTLTIGSSVKTICVDTPAEATLLHSLTPTLNNLLYTTYCTFTPGGTFYTVQGNSQYDFDGNGCDTSDVTYPIMNFNVLSGSVNNNFYANNTSSYTIPLIAGAYTITPAIENPGYFTISPPTITLTLPAAVNPVNQNFCLTANGSHNDLEVVLVPKTSAVPGSDATYKIIYKNKGTTTQSGSVSFNFSDAVLDFVSANPAISNQSVNALNWNFTSLLPQESRVIEVKLNLNSAVETPPINSGNVLNYTTTVTGNVDELPTDNTSVFNQVVVNSLDPNDKTCIEGTTISPAMVGKYVHYVIRFENTGTANAQNIVVKDIIDAGKFDISSLVPLNGSHLFTTRITNTNQVEFIFENINLPFAAGTNDGYLTFKIKTKSSLVIGDTFTNNASIYFAYNAPIVTNTASTTVQALAIQDFEFGNYFSLYPNPAKEVLNIEMKDTIGVKSMDIYNLLGQLLIAIPNAENISTIDVSNLKSGTYFIKINTDQGSASAKFIKK